MGNIIRIRMLILYYSRALNRGSFFCPRSAWLVTSASTSSAASDRIWTMKRVIMIAVYREKDLIYQGVSVVKENMIELRFYADDKPHSAEHDYVIFKFPVI